MEIVGEMWEGGERGRRVENGTPSHGAFHSAGERRKLPFGLRIGVGIGGIPAFHTLYYYY